MTKQILSGLLLFTTTQAFGAAHQETLQLTGGVSVAHLRCVTSLGRDSGNGETTEMTGPPGGAVHIATDPFNLIELKHFALVANGCDRRVLNGIVTDAERTFGFLTNIPIEINKITRESIRIGGRCEAYYIENLRVEIAPGIVLESQAIEERPANDCP